MDQLLLSVLVPFALLSFGMLLTLAPIFAFAYARRQFGGSGNGYLKAYLATAFGAAALLTLLGAVEQLSR